jgi:hypothetical protein
MHKPAFNLEEKWVDTTGSQNRKYVYPFEVYTYIYNLPSGKHFPKITDS